MSLFSPANVGPFKLKHRVVVDPILMGWGEAQLSTYCRYKPILVAGRYVLRIIKLMSWTPREA